MQKISCGILFIAHAYLVWIPFAQAVLHSPHGPQSPHTFSRNIPALFLRFVYLFVLNRDIQCSIISLNWCIPLREALRKIYPHLRVLSLFSSRWNWDSSTPSPAGECAPRSGGRGTLACGRGGGRSQFRRGDSALWCSVYLCTLCISCIVQTHTVLHAPQRVFPLFFRYPPEAFSVVDSGHSLKGPGVRNYFLKPSEGYRQLLSETDKSEGVLGFGNSVSASVSKSIPAILGRNWDKNVKTLATCYSQKPQPAECTPLYGFLGL